MHLPQPYATLELMPAVELDRVLVPALGSAHRCLQNSPPDSLGSGFVAINLFERVLYVPKRALGNGHIVRILEFKRVRLFEDWPKGNCSLGAQSVWLIGIAYDSR